MAARRLPYYRALNPQDAARQPPRRNRPGSPRRRPGRCRAAMLPVRSVRLSPGDEPRRVIRAPGLTPLFLVGDDDRSRAWLQQRRGPAGAARRGPGGQRGDARGPGRAAPARAGL